MDGTLPDWVSPAFLIGTFLVLSIFERVLPLRRRREMSGGHLARNLVIAALSFGLLAVVQAPFLEWVVERVDTRGFSAWSRLEFPPVVTLIVAFLFLDYTLWIWHWLNHKVPFLWRFHLVHHVDHDLDASTALRFHFGEMFLSIGFRTAQVLVLVVVLGASLAVVNAWQAILLAGVLFHHSNVRLPCALDAALTWLIVTPRMHGIHHSTVRVETDSNWSSLLTLWDRLHGTLRLDVDQARIVIGVPAYAAPLDVTLPKLIVMPFRSQRDDWDAEALKSSKSA